MYSTTVGSVTLTNVVTNAAGVWDTRLAQLTDLNDTDYCGALVTKSCTAKSRRGNEYPKYYFPQDCNYSLNSNGLENLGIDKYLEIQATLTLQKPYIYSVGGLSDEKRIQIIQKIPPGQMIELNLSCPNLGSKGPAYDPASLEHSLRTIFQQIGPRDLGLKLPPYFTTDQFEAVTNVLAKFPNIRYIVSINSIPGSFDIDIDNNRPVIAPNDGFGGLGGAAIFSVSLANVRRFRNCFRRRALDIDIIGCGGVTSGADVMKYIMAGARAVQIGTCLFNEGPQCFQRITKELELLMKRKGWATIDDAYDSLIC